MNNLCQKESDISVNDYNVIVEVMYDSECGVCDRARMCT